MVKVVKHQKLLPKNKQKIFFQEKHPPAQLFSERIHPSQKKIRRKIFSKKVVAKSKITTRDSVKLHKYRDHRMKILLAKTKLK